MFFLTKLAGALLKPLTLVMMGLLLGLMLVALTRWRRAGLTVLGLATLGLGLISTWPLAHSLVASLQRLAEGIRLWRLHPEAVLVTSGALASGRSQASIAAELAVALGVPRAQIHTLPEARNTEEEAAAYANLASRLAAEQGTEAARQPVVVTAASHQPRAMIHFRNEGLDPLPAPIAHRAVDRRRNRPGDFVPSSGHIRTTEMAWHEVLGQHWNRLRGR